MYAFKMTLQSSLLHNSMYGSKLFKSKMSNSINLFDKIYSKVGFFSNKREIIYGFENWQATVSAVPT